MGVEGFKGYLQHSYEFRRCFLKKVEGRISSLFMDCNSIFHGASRDVYKLGDKYTDKERRDLMKVSKEKLEEQHISAIIRDITSFIEKFNPEDNLIMAVDGVANSGKLQQQKPRRFLKAVENGENDLLIFDSNSITPGTLFMKRLDRAIVEWLETYKGYLPEKTVYSSHLQPGEGEHKIFDYIRRGDYIKGRGHQIVLGMDNDLIILSTVSPMKNLFMVPEDGKPAVDVTKMREVLLEVMGFKGSDPIRTYQDFAVIVTLLGNDFLPKFPNVPTRSSDAMRIIFKCYRWMGKHLTDLKNNIIWKNYHTFLQNFDRYNGKDTSSGRGYNYIQYFQRPPKISTYPEIMENTIIMNKRGVPVNQVYDREEHILDFDLEKFTSEWYRKQFNPDVLQWDGERVKGPDKKLILDMCVNYLKTLQWCQYYYTVGYKYISNLHFYHYTYSPVMTTVVNVLQLLIKKEKTSGLRNVKWSEKELQITPVHQLLSVIPFGSIDLIEEYRDQYERHLMTLNPVTFYVSRENMDKDHHRKAILPSVNVPHIDEIMKKEGIVVPDELEEVDDLVIIRDNRLEDLSVSMEEIF